MTIRQILSERDKRPDYVEVNYTNEKGVCWRTQTKRPYQFETYFPFANCPVQSFKEPNKNGERYEIFSVRSKDLPEYIVAVNDYTPPARKSDLDSGKMTVRDYLATQKNIKKVRFVRVQRNFQYKDLNTNHVQRCETLYWYTDYFDVQELSGSLSFMADLFVDTVKISDGDETSLQIFTTEYEDWEKQEQLKAIKQWKKREEKSQQKNRKILKKIKKGLVAILGIWLVVVIAVPVGLVGRSLGYYIGGTICAALGEFFGTIIGGGCALYLGGGTLIISGFNAIDDLKEILKK